MAFALNTGVLAVEAAGGVRANSLSLLLDAVHNLSDELGLLLLVLAYTLRTGLSGRLLQSANFFNSVGLTAISAVLLWQAAERLAQPVPVLGSVSVAAGLLGAAGNWAVVSVLRIPSRDDAAIRLAYVHNLGDILLSLAPCRRGRTGSRLGVVDVRLGHRRHDRRRNHRHHRPHGADGTQGTTVARERPMRSLMAGRRRGSGGAAIAPVLSDDDVGGPPGSP
jgi:hypothetical protein